MRNAKAALWAGAVFLVCAGAAGREARADYYKYIDNSGAVCITNKIDAVPPKYRATMKVVREETLAQKDKGSRKEAPREPSAAPDASSGSVEQQKAMQEEPAAGAGKLFTRFPWLKPLLVVFSLLAVFFIVIKLSSRLPSPLLARVICLSFFLGVFLFAYKTYAEHVTSSYFSIKKKVLAMFEQANRREMPDSGRNLPDPPVKAPPSP